MAIFVWVSQFSGADPGHNLRQTMANAAEPVIGKNDGIDSSNTWAMIQMGMTDPVDQITITDWTTIVKMMQEKCNPRR